MNKQPQPRRFDIPLKVKVSGTGTVKPPQKTAEVPGDKAEVFEQVRQAAEITNKPSGTGETK